MEQNDNYVGYCTSSFTDLCNTCAPGKIKMILYICLLAVIKVEESKGVKYSANSFALFVSVVYA